MFGKGRCCFNPVKFKAIMANLIQNKIDEINKVISRAKKMTFENLVTWEELSNWAIGEQRNISGSLNLKILEEDNIMIFKTTIPDEFVNHWHDFFESNFLVKGKLKDKKRIYKKGDWMYYKLLEPHFIKNLKESMSEPAELIVIFTR